MKKLTIFEITLAGMILGVAIAAKYFDRFIPHVHPLHIVVLLIGLSIMRFRVSIILMSSYIILKIILFGPGGITAFMVGFHIAGTLSLLIVSLTPIIVKKMDGKYKSLIIIPIIILTMSFYLVFAVIGDTDYSAKDLPFVKKLWLNLIYPGDWLNVLIATAFSIVIVPIAYISFDKVLKQRLEKTVW